MHLPLSPESEAAKAAVGAVANTNDTIRTGIIKFLIRFILSLLHFLFWCNKFPKTAEHFKRRIKTFFVPCGYSHVFEGPICKTLFDFNKDYDPQRDRLWFAEAGDKKAGAIAVAKHPDGIAQLRWFLIHP